MVLDGSTSLGRACVSVALESTKLVYVMVSTKEGKESLLKSFNKVSVWFGSEKSVINFWVKDFPGTKKFFMRETLPTILRGVYLRYEAVKKLCLAWKILADHLAAWNFLNLF